RSITVPFFAWPPLDRIEALALLPIARDDFLADCPVLEVNFGVNPPRLDAGFFPRLIDPDNPCAVSWGFRHIAHHNPSAPITASGVSHRSTSPAVGLDALSRAIWLSRAADRSRCAASSL